MQNRYDDVCDVTTQDFICTTMDEYFAGYAIGWHVGCRMKEGALGDCTISWQGRDIDSAKHDCSTFTELNP